MSPLLVHAVIRARDEPTAHTALPDAVTITGPGVAAVTSEVAGEVDEPAAAAAHLELLSSLTAVAPALPVAFATVAPDEQTVRRELLEAQSDTLRAQLERVTDLVEVQLRLRFDLDASLRTLVAHERALQRLVQATRHAGAGIEERIALGEEVARRLSEHHAQICESLTAPVRELAERAVVLTHDEATRAEAYLLRRSQMPAMDAAVTGLRSAAGEDVEIEYVGPLPPLTFLGDLLDERHEPVPSSSWGW